MPNNEHPEIDIREDRTSVAEDLNIRVGNSGADEHSQIAQADAAITPGAKTPILHLLGTSHIPPALQGEFAYLIGSAYADREIELPDLPIADLEFGAQVAIANLQISNSISGRNQDTKAKMINGVGQVMKRFGRSGGKGNPYESNGEL